MNESRLQRHNSRKKYALLSLTEILFLLFVTYRLGDKLTFWGFAYCVGT